MKENMYYGAGPFIFKRAEELRANMTSAEKIIWQHVHINQWKVKFRRQHPISNFIVDFYCHPLKLVIEIDGDIHDLDEVKKNDVAREEILKSFGLTVLRFKNEDIYKNNKTVLKRIDETIKLLQSVKGEFEKIDEAINLHQSLPLGDGGKRKLLIVKIGGNIIDDESKLSSFLKSFALLKEKKILVHGGGKLATKMAEQLGVEQKMVDGRRITDAETLRVVAMVYGYINKNIAAILQSYGCNSIGLGGMDGNVILAHKRRHATIDYGFVGDIDKINVEFLEEVISSQIIPVLSPVTHDGEGQLLNTNADTIAQEVAKALCDSFETELIFTFEKNGVLSDVNDEGSLIKELNADLYNWLKSQDQAKIAGGMIPKLDNAFSALGSGVKKVRIGKAESLNDLIAGKAGTTIVNE
jgi:acetylglutamate kinase